MKEYDPNYRVAVVTGTTMFDPRSHYSMAPVEGTCCVVPLAPYYPPGAGEDACLFRSLNESDVCVYHEVHVGNPDELVALYRESVLKIHRMLLSGPGGTRPFADGISLEGIGKTRVDPELSAGPHRERERVTGAPYKQDYLTRSRLRALVAQWTHDNHDENRLDEVSCVDALIEALQVYRDDRPDERIGLNQLRR
jgi:hypothetical protein